MIDFTYEEYLSFKDTLSAGRGRYLFIEGDKIVAVDQRSTKRRDPDLCVDYYTKTTLPHYQGLLGAINYAAQQYEQGIMGRSGQAAARMGG